MILQEIFTKRLSLAVEPRSMAIVKAHTYIHTYIYVIHTYIHIYIDYEYTKHTYIYTHIY